MGALSAFGPRAASKGLQMHVEVDPALPSMVNGDVGRIRQVLHNLVANAVKFTNVGEIVIWARPVASDSDTATIEWTVSDTGIGIPAAQLGSLFNEFVQADNSVTQRFGGSGLGLAISRQIVEQMRGNIDVESMPGTGSTFRFRSDAGMCRRRAGLRRRIRTRPRQRCGGVSTDWGGRCGAGRRGRSRATSSCCCVC